MPSISDAKCILIVGATSGIGRELAKAIHDLPSKPTVIVSGRRQERLDELSSAYERMVGVRFDVTSGRKGIEVFVKDILAKYPQVRQVRPYNLMTELSEILLLSSWTRSCSLQAYNIF